MGACVSSHHNSSSMKAQKSSRSNRNPDNQVLIQPSPVEGKLPIIHGAVAVKPQWPPLQVTTANSRDSGVAEETFFDSQAWLDSDCESDFMSVKGEFTPSRGSTPVHHNFFPTGTAQMKKGALVIDDHKPSTNLPTKKRLSELFNESQRESRDNVNNENVARVVVRGGGLKTKRERWVEIVHVRGCLPREPEERRKKA